MNASTSQRDGRGSQGDPGGIGLTSAQRDDLARAKRTGLWVGLLAPLVVITAALVLVLVWMPRMPNPAATHWGGSGGPDDVTPTVGGSPRRVSAGARSS